MDQVKKAFDSIGIMDVLKIVGILAVIISMYNTMDSRVTSLEKDLDAQEKRCTNRHERQEKDLDEVDETFDEITETRVKK